jgi:hypothetical protein
MIKKQSYIKILKEYNIDVLKLLARKCNIPITYNSKYKTKDELIKDINIVLKKIQKNKKKYQNGGTIGNNLSVDISGMYIQDQQPLSFPITPSTPFVSKEIALGSFCHIFKGPKQGTAKNLVYKIIDIEGDDKNIIKLELIEEKDDTITYDTNFIGKIYLKSIIKEYIRFEECISSKDVNFSLDLNKLKGISDVLYEEIYNDICIRKLDKDQKFTIKLEAISIIDDVDSDLTNIQLIYRYSGIPFLNIIYKDDNELKKNIRELLENINNFFIDKYAYHFDIKFNNILYDYTRTTKLILIDYGEFIESSDKLIEYLLKLKKNNKNILNMAFENAIIKKLDGKKNIDILDKKLKTQLFNIFRFHIMSSEYRTATRYSIEHYEPTFYISDELRLDRNNININENENTLLQYLNNTYLNFDYKSLCEKMIVFNIGILLQHINEILQEENKYSAELIDKCLEMNYLYRCDFNYILNNLDKKIKTGGKYKKNNKKNSLNNKMNKNKKGGKESNDDVSSIKVLQPHISSLDRLKNQPKTENITYTDLMNIIDNYNKYDDDIINVIKKYNENNVIKEITYNADFINEELEKYKKEGGNKDKSKPIA